MLKLVSEVGTKWSYLNGEQIYGNVVWLSNLNDVGKYTLLDENYNKIEIHPIDYLVDE